jgi:UDP-GlcNAc:undecaprenyl-phosphate/decaprenyl-phosphate GlcNAc-1-phosphate transferase
MRANAILFLVPAISLLLTVLFVPLMARLAERWGCVAQPKKERWHTRPTPMLGGIAFFLGFLPPIVILTPDLLSALPFLIVAAQMFVVGLYDDLRRINPATKLIGQIISAATAIFFGYSLGFFTWQPLDALLTALWIVGLTNALNLLDNMDGLAGGIALIAALYLAFLFNQHGDTQHTVVALALAGAAGAFLIYNFYPASIFMGDAGSLFLGSALALLTVQANGQASNILSLVAVPTCILLVPILDTILVTITRLLRGQSISQGGRDHTSHRLVILGLSERQTVLLLYLMASIAGGTAVLIKWFSYSLSLAILPLVLIAFTLFTAYLAQVEIVSEDEGRRKQTKKRLTVLLTTLTYKRRLLEVILDFLVISSAYYLAFAFRYEFQLDDSQLRLFLNSLPLVLAATYTALFFFGIYRGLWRYTGLEDLVRIGQAVACGTLLSMAAVSFVYQFAGYSRMVFIVYGLLLLFGVAGSRLSFRFFGLYLRGRPPEKVPVLIYGAGDGGEIVVRECRNNSHVGYRPIGFLDDDPRKQGRTVQGLRIFGGSDKLAEIIQREEVAGCIISSPSILANGNAEQIRSVCREQGLWVKQLRLEFIDEDSGPYPFLLPQQGGGEVGISHAVADQGLGFSR